MNRIKRFGTIYLKDMTKEIEDTINNDENQMKKLYDRIEELEEENRLLKQQNEMYLKIIEKNNIIINDKEENIKNNEYRFNRSKIIDMEKIKKAFDKIDIKEEKEEEDTYKINKEENNEFLLPTPSKSSETESSHSVMTDEIGLKLNNINKQRYKKIMLLSFIYKNRNKVKNILNKNKQNKKPKVRVERDRSLPIMKRFKVKVYEDIDLRDSEILQFVSSEDCFMIEYQYKIAEKVNKNIENISIDDIIDFKIKYEGFRNISSRRTEIRHLITRSKYLFEKYGKKLSKFKISLNHLKIMNDEEWNEWKIEFDKLYNEICKNNMECKHVYRNNKKCGKINCKINHKDNI